MLLGSDTETLSALQLKLAMEFKLASNRHCQDLILLQKIPASTLAK